MAEGFDEHEQKHATQLADFLARHPNTLVLTGAGMSTASGIPGYRDREGVRRGNLPTQGPEFRRSHTAQRRYWARSMVGWPVLAGARPNAGHRALAALEQGGHLRALLTQNVDGLHTQAGSRAVLELHGNIHVTVCLDCGKRTARAAVQEQLVAGNPQFAGIVATPLPDGDAQLEPEALADFRLPACPHCDGTLMPDVVFFGDNVPAARTAAAVAMMEEAGALLVVGSSLVVFSGFRFCRMAHAAGKPIAALNIGYTRADPLLTLKIEKQAESLLPAVARLFSATGGDTPFQHIAQKETQ